MHLHSHQQQLGWHDMGCEEPQPTKYTSNLDDSSPDVVRTSYAKRKQNKTKIKT